MLAFTYPLCARHWAECCWYKDQGAGHGGSQSGPPLTSAGLEEERAWRPTYHLFKLLKVMNQVNKPLNELCSMFLS